MGLMKTLAQKKTDGSLDRHERAFIRRLKEAEKEKEPEGFTLDDDGHYPELDDDE